MSELAKPIQRRCEARCRKQTAARVTWLIFAVAVLPLTAPLCSRVRADEKLPPLRVEGFSADAQLVGGAGLGLGGKLANDFLGRLRAGLLYAHEPWIANAGVSIEVGALAKLGVGCELELNTWSGLFADVGLSRVSDREWMSHVSVGYTVLGLEWQHRFDTAKPSHALLLEVRLPLGMWWFLVGSKTADRTVASVRKAQPPGVVLQPSAASPAAVHTSDDLPELRQVASVPRAAPSDADRDEAKQLLAEAQRDTESGDQAAAATAFERAYERVRDARILVSVADANIAQAKLRSAAGYLRRFLETPADPREQDDVAHQTRTAAQSKLADVERRIARLRLQLGNAHGDETVELDGTAELGAALGYDVALDPGDHNLAIKRAGLLLVTQSFHANDGELVRLALTLP